MSETEESANSPTAPGRTRIRRGARNAVYDRAVINRMLDANLVCHVGFTEVGEARIIPTAYLRLGDAIYLHGNRQNRMMNALASGQPACISVLQLDGLVLARSGFHHSVNYQSVVLFGTAAIEEDKVRILDAFVDKLAMGRSAQVRPYTEQELNATLVLRIPIDEASAKVRIGDPVDDEADYALDIWAGVLPLHHVYGELQACARLPRTVTAPANLVRLERSLPNPPPAPSRQQPV